MEEVLEDSGAELACRACEADGWVRGGHCRLICVWNI